MVLDDYGYQDIQNLRKEGKHLKGVNGHTKINEAAVDGTYNHIRSGFHFVKDQPAESHVIIYTFSSEEDTDDSKLYQNTAAIPSVGSFSALHTNSQGADMGLFSKAPQGNMLYANGEEALIWGGSYFRIGAFITSTAAITNTVTNARDYSAGIQNTGSGVGQTATIAATGERYFLAGSTRPAQALTFTFSSENTGSATVTCKEWDGDSWNSLSLTDNTNGFKQDGFVSFASTEETSKQKYLEGYLLYWYQCDINSGTAIISNVTVDAPIQQIKNIWDGSDFVTSTFRVDDGTSIKSYDDEVSTDDPAYYAVLSSLANTDEVYIGFAVPMQAVNLRLVAGQENINASTLTVSYWNGSAWTAVSSMNDGTASAGGATIGKSGVISWSKIADGVEFRRSIAEESPSYYYRLTFSAALDASTQVYYVTGIENPETVGGYRIPAHFQNRAWLFSEKNGEQNKGLYSAYNAPDVYNGADSGALYFGNETKITGAGTIYNVYNTTGLEQLIVTKADETWRVFGDNPDTWQVQQISETVGNVAPRSVDVCDISDFGTDQARHVMFWQAGHGIIMCDGATVQTVSDDISSYWDANSTVAIPSGRLDDTVGWCDKSLNAYKVLISSGAGQTSHNVELEYNIKDQSWTKIYRENATGANPLQAGWSVSDTNGRSYSYGGTDEGTVYRLENGTTWSGVPINEYVQTKELLFSDQPQGFMQDTTIKYFRLAFENKAVAETDYFVDEAANQITDESGNSLIFSAAEAISVTHTCNQGTLSLLFQEVIDPIFLDSGPVETRDSVLGPCLTHSFKLESDISTVNDGMELIGIGVYFERLNSISKD